MKKNKEEVKITLLGNEEKDYIMAIDINGIYYKRKSEEPLEDFLGRTTWEHIKATGVNIFPYFTSKKYENIYSQTYSAYLYEKEKEKSEKTRLKIKKKKLATRVAAAAIGIGMIGTVGCSKINKQDTKTDEEKAKVQTEQSIEQDDLKSKSVKELVELLDEKSGQKAALEKIVDTQNFFNTEVAPSIWVEEDGNAKLFLTEDEVLSTYIYLNILNEGPTKLNKIFGQSDAIWINKAKDDEKPVYEKLTKEQVENEFESMVQVLGNYYKWGIEPTGLTNLFENEEEQEFYTEFEELVLEFNRTGSEEAEDNIHKFFGKTFGEEQIDPLYEKYPGACALIARTAVPALKENGVVCDKGFSNIMNIYRCEIGDSILDTLAQMFDEDMRKDELGNNYILNKLYKKMDRELINANRNIKNSYKVPTVCDSICNLINNCDEKVNCNTPVNCNEKEETVTKEKVYNPSNNNRIKNKERKHKKCKYYKIKEVKIPKYKDTFEEKKETKTVTKKETIITDDREKVKEKFTEDEAKEAEKKANCKEQVKEKNEKENKKADDIQRGNNDAVDDFINNNGKTGKPSDNESDEYKNQYNKTNQDLEEVKRQQEEYDKTHPVTTIEEVKEKHYDNSGNEKSTNNNNNLNKVTKTDSNDSDSNSKETSEIKRVKSIMINGKEYIVRSFEYGESYIRARG